MAASGKGTPYKDKTEVGVRANRIGAWACSSDEADIMSAEQRSPGRMRLMFKVAMDDTERP